MPVVHLYVIYGEMFVQVFCPFLKKKFFFSLILSLSLVFVPTAHLLVCKPMYKADFQSAGIKLLYHKVLTILLRVCNHLFL